MYCWKSINLYKDFGVSWLYLISMIITLLSFSIMFIPLSIVHTSETVQELGVFYLLSALLLLPAIHSFMHILPLLVMHKHTRLTLSTKHKCLPIVHYYTKKYLTKRDFLVVAIAPTLLITVPGIIASYVIADYYVYILLFTSIHIGITFQDFMYIRHLTKAPKKSFVENGSAGFNILIK